MHADQAGILGSELRGASRAVMFCGPGIRFCARRKLSYHTVTYDEYQSVLCETVSKRTHRPFFLPSSRYNAKLFQMCW